MKETSIYTPDPRDISMDSRWWADLKAEQERFRAAAQSDLQAEYNKVDVLLQKLVVSQSRRVRKIVDEGVSELEQKQHAAALRELQAKEATEAREFELEQSRLARESEMKRAQLKAEQDSEARRARAEAAEKKRKELEKADKEAVDQAIKNAADSGARDAKVEVQKEKEDAKRAAAAQTAAAPKKAPEAPKNIFQAGNEQATLPKNPLQAPSKTDPSLSKPAEKVAAPQAGFPPSNIQADFKANQDRIEWIKQNVKLAMSSKPADIRKKTMDIKLELRPKFGMLTNTKAQLAACRSSVKAMFQNIQSVGDTLLFQWTMNLYAKLLVEQSESEANVQLQNALPLAMLTILLWDEFPELGDFVIPRFIKRCPQLIGYYCPTDTKQGRTRMGWKMEDEDTYESEEQYMGRLSGICAVWACMTQTKLGAASQKPHPYNLSHSWIFVSRLLNKPSDLVSSTDYALAAAWWDMTALRLHDAFGKQAHKLLMLLWDDYTRDRMDPPAMRLRGLGENWQTTGQIEHAWKVLT